jgi:hypothetical protein
MNIWADAVVFRCVFKGGLALLASHPDKYFIVLGDDIQVYKRVLFFFAIPIGTIDLKKLMYHTGIVK